MNEKLVSEGGRYEDDEVITAYDVRNKSTTSNNAVAYAVHRTPGVNPTPRVKFHEWKQADRWDLLAVRYLGKADEWWRLLDQNPSITDPLMMEPGTLVMIPHFEPEG